MQDQVRPAWPRQNVKRFDLDNPDDSTQFQHCNLLLTQNRAFPVQPTVIEFPKATMNYLRLPKFSTLPNYGKF